MENNTNLLGQLNISNYSIHILSKYIHELIFDNVVYQNDHNLARYGECWYKGRLECPRSEFNNEQFGIFPSERW
jgi:L-rhamnose mutarotase